jgi:hypothetical protein
MIPWVHSAIARTHRRLRGLIQPLHGLIQPLRGLWQRFLGLTQSLPEAYQSFLHAYQSLKEACQPLQEAQNQSFGINQPKTGTFEPTVNHAKRNSAGFRPQGLRVVGDHNSRSEQPVWGIHLVAGLGSQNRRIFT